jgi:hypothetical protein
MYVAKIMYLKKPKQLIILSGGVPSKIRKDESWVPFLSRRPIGQAHEKSKV